MGFRTGAYATVWETSPVSSSLTKMRISTSRKDKKTGQWVQDFAGYAMAIGTSTAAKALKIAEKGRIKLGDVDVTSKYDKNKKVTYTNFSIFSFDEETGGGDAQQGHAVDDGETDNNDGKLPF